MSDMGTILILGCGNMAGAMLDGWLASGIPPERFAVYDPVSRTYPDGVTALAAMPEDGHYDAILLGFKPQDLAALAPAIAPLAGDRTVIMSILAGVELGTLRRHFARAEGAVRVMPNLAVAIGKSPVGLAAEGLSAERSDAVFSLFDRLGTAEWVAEEEFDLFTALAGSGPAFLYRVIDTLAAAAANFGFPRDKALRTAIAMVEGAAALAAHSADEPATLADRVASPGGTTRAGLDVLDHDQRLLALMTDTLGAARDRSDEMTREARGAGVSAN